MASLDVADPMVNNANPLGPGGKQEVDVVIIGGGHNGLVAGTYLGRSGFSVAIVEAAPVLGGMAAMGYPIPQAPAHRINMGAVETLPLHFSGIVEELELRRFGYREEAVDPGFMGLRPDGSSLAFWRDPKRTADEIRHFSQADASAFMDFVEVFDAMLDLGLPIANMNPHRPRGRDLRKIAASVARNRRQLKAVAAFSTAPLEQALAEFFRHPAVIDPLAVWSSGPPGEDGSAVRLLPYALFYRFGAGRPIGGMAAFIDALERAFRAAGGSVALSEPVVEIQLSQDGRARGVVTESGREIRAKAVVATCDPRATLRDMLPAGTLSRQMETRVDSMPAFVAGVAQLKVDLALSGRVQLERHEQWRGDGLDLRKPTMLIGGVHEAKSAFHESVAGRIPSDVMTWTVVPTAIDATQAPTGQDTMYVWAWPVPLQPDGGWDERKAEAAQHVVTQISQCYEGIEGLEIGRFVETTDDLEKRVRITNGCLEHVDCSPFRMGPLRPAVGLGGYRTPVEGLFLGGSGSHPGVGIHGIPGRLCAREVVRTLSRSRLKRLMAAA